MRWSIVLAALVFLASCKKDAPPPPPPPKEEVIQLTPEQIARLTPPSMRAAEADTHFWAWVHDHLDALKALKTGTEPAAGELAAELEKVEPGLVFELGLGQDQFELVISADGDRNRFAIVQRLVSRAPPLAGTRVIAFRPRKPVEKLSMDVGGVKVEGAKLRYSLAADAEHPGFAHVTVYVPGMKDETAKEMKNAGFLLLEAAVGEFALETKIGAVDIEALPAKPKAELKSLKDLPAALDTWK